MPVLIPVLLILGVSMGARQIKQANGGTNALWAAEQARLNNRPFDPLQLDDNARSKACWTLSKDATIIGSERYTQWHCQDFETVSR